MRRAFHPILLDRMRKDERIWVCVADLGFGMFDAIKGEFPNRFVNVGASEQLLIGAAVGLAHDGLIPVAYSITPFLLYRPAEWHRVYLNHEGVKVRLLGAGRGHTDAIYPHEYRPECYAEDGITHWASDSRDLLKAAFPHIETFYPETVDELPRAVDQWLYAGGPSYLNLKR